MRRWFGERLITPAGTRGLVYRGKTTTEGLPNTAADILRDCYIVRSELRGGNVWYELAHDRLVEPIQQDNAEWEKNYRNPVAEARKRGEDNLLTGRGLTEALRFANDNADELTPEERAFLKRSVEAEKQTRARRRTWIAAAVTAIMALSGVGGWALREAQRASANADKASRSEARANQSAADAERHSREAEDAKTIAEQQENLAEKARAEAKNQANLATSGHMASDALIAKDKQPDMAALLSVQGWRAVKGFETQGCTPPRGGVF